LSNAHYDGSIVVDRTNLTVRVYRYVRYTNGRNELLDDTTREFDTLEDAMLFAEKMHDAYKQDGVVLVVRN
jgi:hypothetical protein